MLERIHEWLAAQGLRTEWVDAAAVGLGSLFLIVGAVILNYVAKHIVLRVVKTAAQKSASTWDDAFVDAQFFARLANLAPLIFLASVGPGVFAEHPQVVAVLNSGLKALFILLGVLIVLAFLNGAHGVYKTFKVSEKVRINTVVQLVKVAVVFLGLVAFTAVVFGRSPLAFLGGLGAFSAVLILIFKDAILGFVAGIQLQANDMVRVGDWIEMPKFGADGDVIDVSLTTVKVQNWDKTISSIPAYSLISDSFRNWRGMSESGGRRIKRAVYLDVSSIRFADDELLERFRRMQSLKEYVDTKQQEITAYNRERQVDESLPINGRRMTNVGTFRAYLERYLRSHPMVHPDMTLLVRQLPSGEHGLPIEIYVFSKDQVWANYEAIQADIFDHIFASLPLFDLRAYQAPAGSDVRALAGR